MMSLVSMPTIIGFPIDYAIGNPVCGHIGVPIASADMKTIGERVAYVRKLRKLSQGKVAKAVGISQPTLSELENNQSDGTKKIVELAQVLQVNVRWLSNGEGPMEADEPTPHSGSAWGNVTDGPALRGKVPVISWVQAGNWMEVMDNFAPGDAEKWIDTTYAVRRHTFAVRVTGDSMEPKFPEGALIVVEPDEDPLPGKFVVVRKRGDNEATFKQLVLDGGVYYLKPLNPRYPIMELPADSVIVGVVKQMTMEV